MRIVRPWTQAASYGSLVSTGREGKSSSFDIGAMLELSGAQQTKSSRLKEGSEGGQGKKYKQNLGDARKQKKKQREVYKVEGNLIPGARRPEEVELRRCLTLG